MTNQELNEQVARKLGYDWTKVCIVAHEHESECPFKTPNYCTDIQAAWEIVDNIFAVKIIKAPTNWFCQLLTEEMASKAQLPTDTTADTAPMAIVLAFLKCP